MCQSRVRRTLQILGLAASLLTFPSAARAQFARGATLRLDSGYWTDAQPGFFDDLKLSEWSTTVGIQARLGGYLYVGPTVRHTRTRGSYVFPSDERAQYWAYGISVGGGMDFGSRLAASAGVTLLRGDYCACGDGDPYRRPNTDYLGFQGRVTYFVTDLVGLELGATFQALLNDVEGTRGYNFGFIGLVLELPGYAKRMEE